MEGKRFFGSKKWMAAPIAMMMLFSGLYMIFPLEGPAEGASTLGTVNVTGGASRSFSGVDYILDGNITVSGSGSTLTFTNCNLTLSQDVGLDGVIGGGDDHIYSIRVQDGGYLQFKNTIVTTQTDQLHPYFMIDMGVDGSGSRLYFENSMVEGPGEIQATNGGRIDSIGSIFKKLEYTNDLQYDIDGDGSTTDDADYNDDGPLFTYLSGSKGLIVNTEIRDTFSFTTSSRDGRIAGNITLDGSGTNVTVINSFLDIDFESNRSTGSHNMLKITNGAVAHLVGAAFNVSAADRTYPAVHTRNTGSKAIYYRWIASRVFDGVGIPVEDQVLDIYRIEGSTNRQLTSSYLTGDILDFMDRTSSDWSSTDEDGWSFVPVITDVITPSTMPNSDSYPDFKIEVTQVTETLSSHTSFKNYPNVPDQGEAVDLIASILDGSAESTYAFSDLGGPFEFKEYVMVPSSSSFFSGSDVDLTLSSSTTLNGTSAIVDGRFYPSYYAFDGHLIIRSGGHLTINDTTVSFLTDDSPAYILIEDGGKMELNNVSLSSHGEEDLYIYLIGNSAPRMIMDGGSLQFDQIVARDTGIIDIQGEMVNGSFNLYGTDVDVSVDAAGITSEDIFATDCDLELGGGPVNIGDLDWDNVAFSSRDAIFDTVLDVDRSASLTNVTFSGSLPDGRTKWLKAVGTGVIQKYWWVNVQVQDSVENPIAGASLYVQRVLGPLKVDVSSHTTGDNGTARFSLLEEEIRSTGRTYHGNYRFNASYSGIRSDPLAAVLSGANIDAVVVLPGGPNIVPEMIWTEGTLIDGFPVELKGSVKNDGQFSSDRFSASIMIDGEPLVERSVPELAPGASHVVNATWVCTEGEVNISLMADVNGDVKETDEDDNLDHQINTIGLGPDYAIELDIPPITWAYNTTGRIDVLVSNEGELDPEENPFYVNMTWTDASGEGEIRSFLMFDYIPPGETVEKTVNLTPMALGTLNVVGSVVSKYDRSPINSIDVRTIEVLSLPDIGLVLNSFGINVPDPVTVNTTAVVTFTIENTGDLPAGAFMVSVYDGERTEENKIDLDRSVPGLSPGDDIELEFIWYAGPPTGVHELIVAIDLNDDVREQNEANNEVIFPIRVDTPPDLTFTSNIGVSPSVITEGKNATFWATVKNIGKTMAHNAKVEFALDSDTNVISTVNVDLLPGQEKNISITWESRRAEEESGFRTMFIVADPRDIIKEPDEDNNLRSIDIRVISKPDLYMGTNDLYFSPDRNIDIGEEVTISASVRNSGETPARNVFIRFYDGDPLEGGKIISWKETQPSVSINIVPAGGFRWANVTWTPTTGGDHEIYVILDLVDTIDESDEENNKVFWKMYVRTLPDLEVTNITLYQGDFEVNSVGVGNRLTINTTVENTGDTTAPTFRIRFFNAEFENDPNPIPLGIGMTYLAGTLPGRSSMFVERPWIADYPKGIRTLLVEVDLLEGEEQTTSNNRIHHQVEIFDIQDVPELLLSNSSLMLSTGYPGIDIDLEYEPMAYLGMNISLELNLTNIGGKAASNTTVLFKAYNDTDSWTEKIIRIPFLETNGTDVIRGHWNLKDLGMNMLRIMVDPENSIREFDEGNNVLTLQLEVMEAPDLSIELLRESDVYNIETGQFDMKEDKEYEVTFKVTNNGNFSFHDLQVEFDEPASLAEGESYLRTVDLLPYQEVLVTFRVEPEGSVGDVKLFRVKIDDENSYYESDKDNNEATVIVQIQEGDEPSRLWVWILIIILVLLLIGGAIGYFVYKKYKTKDMAKCSNCGGLVQLDADICPHCGVEFSDELECECGELIPTGATECPACHRPVKADVEPLQKEGPSEEEEKEGREDEEFEEEEEELEELEEEGSEEIEEEAPGEDAAPVPVEEEEEELAECFECGALIPVSAPICPHCGAVFE
ncbi:MAG: CARDB domain-containing protein [Thermoplasmatota archaeon]